MNVLSRWDRSDLKTRLIERGRRVFGIDRAVPDLERFSTDASAARVAHAHNDSDLARLFFEKEGKTVDKWMSYLRAYDRHLSRYRGTDFAMLELGVFRGGSLELWRKYFGATATLFGVDINPACADVVDAPNQVRIGSQADPEFLRGVVSEMGRLDVVLDDGSHVAEHQEASFTALWPLLPVGGIYIIEDLHTAYWRRGYDGGFKRPGTAIEMVKDMIDDMHGWYHGRDAQTVANLSIEAIHMYDSVVFIEKGKGLPPMRVRSGQETVELSRSHPRREVPAATAEPEFAG